MEITRVSALSGKEHTMDLNITEEQIKEWRNGALAQSVFPHLTPDEREFMITGATKEEWDNYFGEEE